MKVIILAAGYGTRLYPLTKNLPKPLVPVSGLPIINFIMEKIAVLNKHFTISEVRVVSNNKFYDKFIAWKRKYKVKAKIINDGSNTPEDRLGAVRDIKIASAGQREDWLVIGGDNLFDDDLTGLVRFARKKSSCPVIGVYEVKSKKEARSYGIVRLNRAGRIMEFAEKPANPKSLTAAACVYFFPKESYDLLDTFLLQNDKTDAAGRYIAWLAKEIKVYGYLMKGKWIDIGHPDCLKRAEEKWGQVTTRPPGRGRM